MNRPLAPLPNGGNLFLELMRETKFQENSLTFDWYMILSKSDLSDPLNSVFWVHKKHYVYLQQQQKIGPIDHHAKFQMFKLSFIGSN